MHGARPRVHTEINRLRVFGAECDGRHRHWLTWFRTHPQLKRSKMANSVQVNEPGPCPMLPTVYDSPRIITTSRGFGFFFRNSRRFSLQPPVRHSAKSPPGGFSAFSASSRVKHETRPCCILKQFIDRPAPRAAAGLRSAISVTWRQGPGRLCQ